MFAFLFGVAAAYCATGVMLAHRQCHDLRHYRRTRAEWWMDNAIVIACWPRFVII